MRLGIALLAALLGCSEPAPRTPPSDEPTPEPTTPEVPEREVPPTDAAPGCTLEPPHRDLTLTAPTGVSIARQADGALALVASTPGGHVVISGDEALAPLAAQLGGPLLALEPLGGDAFLVLSVGACPTDEAARCLSARTVRVGDEVAISDALALPIAGLPRSHRVVATDGMVYLARSYRDAAPTLDRFVAAAGVPERTVIRIGDGLLPEEPVEMLALAADGAAYALLYRHGATEDPASGVVLATQLDEHHVDVLHDALVVESIAWVGTSIAMVVAFEFARPSYLRIAADGEVRVIPRLLPFGADVPEPFGARLVARIDGSPGALEVDVRDGAGDRRGDPIALPGARAASLTREPGGFLVAWVDEAGLHVSRLRC